MPSHLTVTVRSASSGRGGFFFSRDSSLSAACAVAGLPSECCSRANRTRTFYAQPTRRIFFP